MTTCHRLYYVSKVCLRLLRKYTNEIYPNDVPKVEKNLTKKRNAESEDRNETPICNYSSLFCFFKSTSLPLLHNSFLNKLFLRFTDVVHQIPGPAKPKPVMKHMMSSSDVTTSGSQKKLPVENLQLAECVGDVRALLIDILCDEIALSVESEGYEATMEILDECHTTFLSCFNAFYPTNTLKWNCLCDLLMKKDKVRFNSFSKIEDDVTLNMISFFFRASCMRVY